MDNFDKKISEEVKNFLKDHVEFTNGEAERIREKIRLGQINKRKINPVYWVVLSSAAILFLILSIPFINGLNTNQQAAPDLNNETNVDIPEFDRYEGEPLKIGVVGNAPEVREKDLVHFESLTFKDIAEDNFKSMDAIFIMKENLEEASESKYTSIYLESSIPFLFIESTKGIIPFIDETISYNESPEFSEGNFAAGYIPTTETIFKFGLYNDIKNKETMAGFYSEVFEEINKNKLFAIYEGEPLLIGVIGNQPSFRERSTVATQSFTLNDLTDGDISNVDAIFIMEDHLEEATESKYAKVYLESGIPFFFIGASKGASPFISEQLSYEDFPEMIRETGFGLGDGAAGYIPSASIDEFGVQLEYSLYNDFKDQESMRYVYSSMFEEIRKYKIGK